jgi:type 1 fimbria pilin
MIRKTLIGLTAAIAVTAAAASSASAGVKFYVGTPYFGGYNNYYAPACPKVFVGYKTIWNGYGWVQVPRYKRICNYY